MKHEQRIKRLEQTIKKDIPPDYLYNVIRNGKKPTLGISLIDIIKKSKV